MAQEAPVGADERHDTDLPAKHDEKAGVKEEGHVSTVVPDEVCTTLLVTVSMSTEGWQSTFVGPNRSWSTLTPYQAS